ncbi:MAG: aminodeoxychorismate lyase [Pseudomonas sp.]
MADLGSLAAAVPACLIDGQAADRVAANDRGLAYGDGLFETLRVKHGRIALIDLHLARLQRGIQRLRLDADMPLIEAEWRDTAARLGQGVLKLLLTRSGGQRGYAIAAEARTTRILQSFPLREYPPEHAQKGIFLYPCQTRLARQPLLAGIKHLNRLEQVLARSEWTDPQYAEGLVRDTEGLPIECTMGNLFLRTGAGWVTPDLAACGVRGVMRDYLVERLREAGEVVLESTPGYAELLGATEVFCCNSLYGVWPVIGLEDKRWQVGNHTRFAQTLVEQVMM